MKLPYEGFFKESNFSIARAEEILTSGWSIKGIAAVPLNSIPWDKNGAQDRSLTFALHSLRIIETLLRAYSATEDTRFLEPAARVALDWCSRSAGLSSEVLWDRMVAALRAHRLAFILDAGEAAGLLADEEKEHLWQQLLRHQAFLADDANIDFHNNRGYFQIACQMAMGRRLRDRAPEMRAAQTQAETRMRAIIQTQFTSEYSHRENSPGYFKQIYETLKIIVESGLMPELENVLQRMEEALSCFVLPDGHLAMLGDTDLISLSATITTARKRWQSDAMRYVVSGGKCGRAPEEGLKIFPESGYGLVRARGKKPFSDSAYLLLNAAFHSRTHRHADDLSLLWADRGATILVDAGRYGYAGKTVQGAPLWNDGFWYSDPHRVYCESTHAHNTLQIDGRNMGRRGVKPYGSALTFWGEAENGVYWMEARCKHFKSIHHARMLFFMPAEWLVVFDWFYDNNKQDHSVKQWFHFAPDIDLIRMSPGYTAFLPGVESPLKVAPLLKGMETSPCLLGQGETEQGWFSPGESQFIPNYAISMNASGPAGSLATVFAFSGTLTADTDFSRVNISGRNGQFTWKDGNGAHKLHFQRQDSGTDVHYTRF